MGLSASQARLLTLTARQHQIEYRAQRIKAEKLQLANESDQVYRDYMNKLDATKIQYKQIAADGSYSYNDATFARLAAEGYLFNVNGTITNVYKELDPTPENALNLKDGCVLKELQAKGIDITAEDSEIVLSSLVSEGLVLIMEQADEMEAGYSISKENPMWVTYVDPMTGEKRLYKPDGIYDKDGNKIRLLDANGNPRTDDDGNPMYLEYSADDCRTYKDYLYKVYKDSSLSSSTRISETTDEIGLRKAEAEYEANMSRINSKDSRYDTQLSQLETERNAITNQMESLKTVAKDNVERTFKLFG